MDFIATKRVGAILTADIPLTWHEAGQVLELLNQETGALIDKALQTEVRDFFEADAELVRGKAADADALAANRSRGQVYHSKRIRTWCCGFELLISVSFTVCVKLDLPFLGKPPRVSQSKFWCSAIIIGDGPLSKAKQEERFAEACDKIEAFAPRILELVQPLYGHAVREVNPDIAMISATGDRFSTVMLQVDDDKFRDQLALIERGEKSLSQLPSDSALGLLNQLYSGPFATTYLHVGRPEQGSGDSEDAELDAILHSDAMRARALLIETKAKNKRRADWRMLGVTSASEPVDWRSKGRKDDVERLVHSPANVLSAEVAAEIGEQF